MFFNKDGSPQSLEERLNALEYMLYDGKYDHNRYVRSKTGKGFAPAPQPQIFYGCWQAYCVSTVDPEKRGRVRFFQPLMYEFDVQVGQLDFALPISSAGGFDDCGMTWPPPAGSRLLLIFEHGDRRMPYYLGTSWELTRGSQGANILGPKQEWQSLWAKDRGQGYLVGETDGSQVFPPWNTESYNGYDFTSDKEFETDVDAQTKITYPNIYGFKTPGRHRWKNVDGNHSCNNRWMRSEWASGRQNTIILKDDHLHTSGQWGKGVGEGTICCSGGEDLSQCKDLSGTEPTGTSVDYFDYLDLPPLEQPTCDGPDTSPTVNQTATCGNPYYKREEECRILSGLRKLQLPQSGIQAQSVAGNQFVMDDSVAEPMGVPSWQLPFSTGCNDMYKGRMSWRTWGGHFIDMSDDETGPQAGGDRWRSDINWVKIGTASGHLIEMNEDSNENCQAGDQRQIKIESTSMHHLIMNDAGNQQCGPRQTDNWPPEGAKTTNQATNGYIELRSGYGLLLRMNDYYDQQSTDQQNIILRAPQTDNTEMGPHELCFQEAASGPGQVMLLVGGNYYCVVRADSFWQVGDVQNPAERMDTVFGNFLIDVEGGVYYNKNDVTLFLAQHYILLGAGQDCPVPPNTSDAQQQGASAATSATSAASSATSGNNSQTKGPCFFPIIVAKDPWRCPYTGYVHFGVGSGNNSMSDRVLASASNPSSSGTSSSSGSGG